MCNDQSKKRNLFFDISIVGVAVALIVLTSAFGLKVGTPLEKGAAAVWVGVYVIYLGVLFLLGYLFPRKSYVLEGLIWICENFSHPKNRHMALFYFALSLVTGLLALLFGLGVL